MVQFIREHAPEVKIVVGGPLIANHARNSQPEELKAALDDIGADIYVVEGQGELALSQIVECLNIESAAFKRFKQSVDAMTKLYSPYKGKENVEY